MSFKSILALVFLLMSVGCVHPYTPQLSSASLIELEPAHEFTSKNPVALKNVQPSVEKMIFLQSGIHSWQGTRKEWTDAAVAMMKRELSKRGLQVVGDNARVLKFSVESAKTDIGWVMVETKIEMTVQTGDGYSAKYVGSASSAMMSIVTYQVDAALAAAMLEMLKDPKMVAYLTK